MSTIKAALASYAQANALSHDASAPKFDTYKLVVVGRDTVTSSGQAFVEGQLAIARPDTFELRGQKHWAVFSGRTLTHVALPEKDVRLC